MLERGFLIVVEDELLSFLLGVSPNRLQLQNVFMCQIR